MASRVWSSSEWMVRFCLSVSLSSRSESGRAALEDAARGVLREAGNLRDAVGRRRRRRGNKEGEGKAGGDYPTTHACIY